MPRHQTLKFSNNLKAKRYNVTDEQKLIGTQEFRAFICEQMRNLNMMRKLP